MSGHKKGIERSGMANSAYSNEKNIVKRLKNAYDSIIRFTQTNIAASKELGLILLDIQPGVSHNRIVVADPVGNTVYQAKGELKGSMKISIGTFLLGVYTVKLYNNEEVLVKRLKIV